MKKKKKKKKKKKGLIKNVGGDSFFREICLHPWRFEDAY
jgi:hypothetical protein